MIALPYITGTHKIQNAIAHRIIANSSTKMSLILVSSPTDTSDLLLMADLGHRSHRLSRVAYCTSASGGRILGQNVGIGQAAFLEHILKSTLELSVLPKLRFHLNNMVGKWT